MSKSLVQKALFLLEDCSPCDKSMQKDKNSSSTKNIRVQKQRRKKKKALKEVHSGLPKDRTEENLLVLEQLRTLKPKSSVAQKVVEYYTKRKDINEPFEKDEPQKSILFDDIDDLKKKKRKKRKAN